jgi:outer membrane biosynthesis protein TonB
VRREASRLEELQRQAAQRKAEETGSRPDALPAAPTPLAQPTTSSGARRRTLFGRTDPNIELVMYAEAWRRKIELNMTFDLVRAALKQPRTDPMVTVALRSDGSVESVTFVRSSGVPQIDEAVRRIVHSQAPYQAFPDSLAREFDVIEIRRTWIFDTAVRLY